jgi:hypothetical protein
MDSRSPTRLTQCLRRGLELKVWFDKLTLSRLG